MPLILFNPTSLFQSPSSIAGVGEPFCYHGLHELCISASGPQVNKIYPKILLLSKYIGVGLLLIYCPSTCLSWSFVFTQFHSLTW